MKMIDITGQTFNELHVEKYVYSQKHPNGESSVMWLCTCSCGEKTIVSSSELRTGGTKSCGHIGASYRERLIRKFLMSWNINHITEYKFADLKLKRCLRFDFAIFNNNNDLLGLIEHQGRQHFEEYSKTTQMGKQQREVTDKMKIQYCKKHKIKLFYIRFDDDLEPSLIRILTKLHVNTVPSLQETA